MEKQDVRQRLLAFASVLLFLSPAVTEEPAAATYLKQGRALRSQRKLQEALDAFLAGIAVYPDTADLHLEAGRLYDELDQPANAADHYESALRSRPDLAPAHAALGILRSEEGRLGEAATHLKSALALDPSNIVARHALGVVREREGDLGAAMEEYRRARELAPREGKVYFGLGSVLEKLGRSEEAIEQFETAAKLDPKYSASRYKLATLCFRLGKKEAGERHMALFHSLKAREHCHRGEVKILLNDLDGAVREFSRALDADPNHAEAHGRLGALYLRLGKIAQAVEHARRAADLDAKPVRFANLSWALHASGKEDEALQWIDKALALDPNRQQFTEQRKTILETKPKDR